MSGTAAQLRPVSAAADQLQSAGAGRIRRDEDVVCPCVAIGRCDAALGVVANGPVDADRLPRHRLTRGRNRVHDQVAVGRPRNVDEVLGRTDIRRVAGQLDDRVARIGLHGIT